MHRLRATIEPLEGRTLLAGSGLAGAYFNNAASLTDKDFARIDPAINFDFAQSPTGNGAFGTRWSGSIEPKFTESYHFSISSAGSVRLWVNNQLIINKWDGHALRTDSGNVSLKGGQHYDIRIEYGSLSNGTGSAKLYWQSARLPKQLVPTNRLFAPKLDSVAPTAPGKPQGFYTTDTTFRFKWSGSSDASGGKVYYDVYENSTFIGTTTNTNYLRTGRTPGRNYKYAVKAVDVFGNEVSSKTLSLTTLAPAAPGAGTGFAASYFSGTALDQFRLTRTDSALNFTFSKPPITTPTGTYSVRWDGKVIPKYSESYTFYLTSDDGARMWVNGQLVIDHWSNHAATTDTATVALTAGKQANVRIEYFQSGGGATAKLEWASWSQARQVVPASQVVPTYVDSAAPSVPGNLTTDNVGQSSVTVTWSSATDDVGVTGYDVYRGSTKVGTTTDTTFSDTGLSAGTTYAYSVRAIDGASHVSSASKQLNVTTSQPVSRDAFSNISAGSFDGSSGVSNSGGNATDFDDGDWIRFDRVNFGNGANSVRINIALPIVNVGGTLELRLDSANGPVIGSLVAQPTGSFSTYYTKNAQISGASGIHDLYVVGRGRADLANVQSLVFRTQTLTRVMALGDSITQEFPSAPGWRYYLYQMLKNAGKDVDFVGTMMAATGGWPANLDYDMEHEGRSGWRADQVLAELQGWASIDRPDVVLIHLGTNDLRAGQTPASTITEMGSIIDVLRGINPNVKIILAKIIPAGDAPDGAVEDYNSRLPGLVATKQSSQSPIALVDQYTGFSLQTNSNDNLHPNDSGDQRMAAIWYAALGPIV